MPLSSHTHAGPTHTHPTHADRPGPDAPRRRTGNARPRKAAALLASAVSVCLLAASAPATPVGDGDRLFPHLGNPGYDVASYDLSFTYPGDNSKPLTAVTTIDAWTTTELDRINLDFAQGDVQSVGVVRLSADFTADGDDLVAAPDGPLPAGRCNVITVRHDSDPVA